MRSYYKKTKDCLNHLLKRDDRPVVFTSAASCMEAFYVAYAERNPIKMEQVWHPDSAICIFDGAPPLTGLDGIMAAWVELFRHTNAPQIRINTVSHNITPHCEFFLVEQRTGQPGAETIQLAMQYANNVFLKTRRGWKLSCHHAFRPAELGAPPNAPIH